MAEKENQHSERLLRWVGLAIVLAVIGWQLYLGYTIQEIGIPSVLTAKFGKPGFPATPSVTPLSKPHISAKIKNVSDTTKVEKTLRDHVGETVYLGLVFVQKSAGGMAEFNGQSDVHKLEFLEFCEAAGDAAFDITVDRECPECRPGIHDRFIFRITKKGHQFFCGFDDDYDHPLIRGSFVVDWVEHVGQGYYVASLTAAN